MIARQASARPPVVRGGGRIDDPAHVEDHVRHGGNGEPFQRQAGGPGVLGMVQIDFENIPVFELEEIGFGFPGRGG